MPKLSAARPPKKLFCAETLVSILGQFAIHLGCLVVAVTSCQQFVDPEDKSMDIDGDFAPNVINSVVFLLSLTMQVNTFLINYQGHPFMQNLSENAPLFRALWGGHVCALVAAVSLFPPINDMFQLVLLPTSVVYGLLPYDQFIFALLFTNTMAAYCYEKVVVLIFSSIKS